jgi:hypothetical protein
VSLSFGSGAVARGMHRNWLEVSTGCRPQLVERPGKQAERLQSQQADSAARSLRFSGGEHGPTEHIRHNLHPRGRVQERSASGNDLAAARHRLKQNAVELAEAQRHSFLACAQDVDGAGI